MNKYTKNMNKVNKNAYKHENIYNIKNFLPLYI